VQFGAQLPGGMLQQHPTIEPPLTHADVGA
jgi:hypothetical protein